MNFLVPTAFLLSVLLPIIVLMYLLKLRRAEQPVSSVYLWRRMVRDVEANAPWQRLRRNLLLIVQLLFLAALILALARPFTWTEGLGGQAAILIFDTSASMAATDVAPNRLGAAKARARQLVDDMADDVRVTVIAAGEGAQVLASSSRDRRQVHLAIEAVEIGGASSDLTAAVELASAIAARQPDTEILVFSDGRVALPQRLAVKGRVRYLPMGISGDNQAIGVLSLQPVPGGGLTAFCQITNYGDEMASRRLALYADDQLINAYDLDIAPRGQRAVVADDLPPQAKVLRAELSGEDALPLDDRAWAVYDAAAPADVTLITEGNLFLETALSLFKHLEVTTIKPRDLEEAGREQERQAALTILDAYLPLTATLPAGNLLFIAPPRSTDYFSVTGRIEHPVPRAALTAGSESADPLLAHVQLAEVSVLEAARVPLPGWARPVIAGDTTQGTAPLLFAGEREGRRVAVLTFDLHRSDLPLQVAFPLLLANLTGWLVPYGGSDLPTQIQPGETVALTLPPEAPSIQVTRPDGTSTRVEAGEGRQAFFADTAQLGVYQAAWGEDGGARFAVNLFAPHESDVQPAAELPLLGVAGEGGDVGGAQQARHEWWRALAFVALALLTVEWLIYQRATLALVWNRTKNAFVRQNSKR